MAVFSSTDWSLTSFNCQKRTHPDTINSTSKSLRFLSAPYSIRRFSLLNSSGYPAPVLDESSDNPKTIEYDIKFPDLQQSMTLDIQNLNDFLLGLCKDPRTAPLAFEYYQKAKDHPEFRPEPLMLKLLIRYLIKSKNWSLISLLSQDFKAFLVIPDSTTCSTLLDSCIRNRKFKVAKALLHIFESKGDVALSAFDSAMRSYNKLHMYRSTVSVFNQMQSAGIAPDSSCYCQVMEAYRKLGGTKKVVSLFNEFVKQDALDLVPFSTRIYGILCDTLGKSGRAFEALEHFREMKKKGIAEDSSIYSSLMFSFARIREVRIAEELFQEARERRMVKDPDVCLKLVLMYVEEGLMEKTLEIVKAMKETRISVSDCILCTIINGYVKKRGLRAALRIYKELISLGCEPGQVTYASLINICCRLELYTEAEKVFSEMEQKGFDRCVVAYSNMVSMYGKVGRIRDAMRLVAKMKERGCEPNVWVYNSLIDMHGRVKDLRQVEKLWKEMKRRKVTPDKITYTSIISAYSKAKDFETCIKLYQEFRINGGKIDRVMVGIMVGVFSKISKIDELVKLLQDMKSEGMELDWRLYRSAMNALRDAGFQVHVKWFEESFKPTEVKLLTAHRHLKTTMLDRNATSTIQIEKDEQDLPE
ncbi:pentatricopeptide repeat-containing protein At5g13770, chloroplastic [Macadamia integrifolia]|uniref:pentatricopeptide repeat-containing protein At5g13770, chloroplastic n=1 Tax=Macadamia integrifolia TaxID=60698 RepID=UPI001C4FE89C|nr:pentatricopeptide repeat-containing protein At5g13770, chloroplastic [Macadamia integrifolia]